MTRFAKIDLHAQGWGVLHDHAAPLHEAPARQRAATMAGLALVSAVLSDLTLGPGRFPYPVMPGVWFGLVLVAGVALWATRDKAALFAVFAATNLAWWGAFEVSLWLYPYVQDVSALPAVLTGMASGLIGSAVTVSGVAYACPGLRTRTNWTRTLAAGSLAGILLEGIDIGSGSALPLLLVWQAAVASSIGWGLTPAPRSR